MGKYKVGETVKTVKELKDYTRTIPSGSKAKIVSDYGNGWYDIEVDGRVYGHSVADTNLAKNASEADAVANARFKPGDKVVVHWGDWRGDDPATIVEQGDYGWIVSFDKYAKESEINEKIITSRNSRNAVVNTALAWKKAVCNHIIPAGWRTIKESQDSWYGDYLALVQSEKNPSQYAVYTSHTLMKPTDKTRAEKDYENYRTFRAP